MLIIPAIDIIDNKVVRLEKGEYDSSKSYGISVPEQVRRYVNSGFNHIHIIDLIASKSGSINAFEIIKSLKNDYNIKIQFGGGIRSGEKVKELFGVGIDKVIIGSLSVNNKTEFEKILKENDPSKIIAAVDVKNNEIFIKGWTENSNIKLNDHIKYCSSFGVNEFLCTDINKDGMLKGPNFDMYKKLMEEFPEQKFIASGGVSGINDIRKLHGMNMHAVVVGKAIYENKIDLKELKKFAD
ncbi:MAG: 1-(5-phosphoribosyl)-5-[(5-phosphoribosylamino)methylideneamino]imidazole-4-carboxamide isomerase [Ignavibacteria bacterium]|jgi:phosphoribosylformimino-5-aminoimidazole carboxamide ribotide isomerase